VVDQGVEKVTDVVDDVADQLDEPVETVTDVVDELADQLGVGETADDLTGALDAAGTDLETVTEDVLALVEQGVPLEDAVDQVLGQLPLSSLDGAPAPSSSGGTPLGGLLGQ
jgi:ABC-type transporter Mla subunit MlaD